MRTNSQIMITTAMLALCGFCLGPLKAHAKAEGGVSVAPPPAVRSSIAGGGATIAPVRLVSMIDAGTRFTLLQNVILPPGHSAVEIASFEAFNVQLTRLTTSNSSQLISAGTVFVTTGPPRCWADYYDQSRYTAQCRFELAGTGAQIFVTTSAPYVRNLDHNLVGAVQARRFSEGVANVLQIDVPAPVAYGSASR